ncbi:hypothetical protein [Streptomyces sp. NPDC054834]
MRLGSGADPAAAGVIGTEYVGDNGVFEVITAAPVTRGTPRP